MDASITRRRRRTHEAGDGGGRTAAGALWRGFTGELAGTVESSRAAFEDADYGRAEALLRGALSEWEGAEGYTHIFIRHSEIDATADAFCAALGSVAARDASAAGDYEALIYRLRGLYGMERLTPGSIF